MSRNAETIVLQKKPSPMWKPNSHPFTARNLRKTDLAGVIFGCKHSTFKECVFKQLFGLPASHYQYVQKITQGMPLFLFNYSDRTLHGVFEASSIGQMNINSRAWTLDGQELTPFPAQVRVKFRMQCQPLNENQFKTIIAENYRPHEPNHFWFELDKVQTEQLVFLFSASPVGKSVVNPNKTSLEEKTWISLFKPRSDQDVMDLDLEMDVPCQNQANTSFESSYSQASIEKQNPPLGKLIDVDDDAISPLTENICVANLSHESSMDWDSFFGLMDAPLDKAVEDEGSKTSKPCSESFNSSITSGVVDLDDNTSGNPPILGEANAEEIVSYDIETVVTRLRQTIGDMKSFQLSQIQRFEHLEEELVESKRKIHDLEKRCGIYNTPFTPPLSDEHVQETQSVKHFQDSGNSILLVGGFDGSLWLPDLISYSASEDSIQPLEPMRSICSYASVVTLKDELYVLGGKYGTSWCDTVESYNVKTNRWVTCASMNRKKGSIAGVVCLRDKIFAIGGGDSTDSFSEVEMLDLDIGKWIFARSMVEKRFSPAAAVMNGAVYVTGGYDGEEYLRSMERFDPRECCWSLLTSMTARRGSHCMTVLNEKLYAVGGYDGAEMISTVEVFEPRVGTWMMAEPMVCARAYMGTVTLGNAICLIGGMRDNEVLDTVECYNEGKGWQLTDLKSVGKKCCFSAVVV